MKQNNHYFQTKISILNGYSIVSELNGISENGYYKSPLVYDKVDSFVNEIIKLEIKMFFYFKNTKKDIIMLAEEEENFKNNNKVCRFCEKNFECDKVRDHCHLTGKY